MASDPSRPYLSDLKIESKFPDRIFGMGRHSKGETYDTCPICWEPHHSPEPDKDNRPPSGFVSCYNETTLICAYCHTAEGILMEHAYVGTRHGTKAKRSGMKTHIRAGNADLLPMMGRHLTDPEMFPHYPFPDVINSDDKRKDTWRRVCVAEPTPGTFAESDRHTQFRVNWTEPLHVGWNDWAELVLTFSIIPRVHAFLTDVGKWKMTAVKLSMRLAEQNRHKLLYESETQDTRDWIGNYAEEYRASFYRDYHKADTDYGYRSADPEFYRTMRRNKKPNPNTSTYREIKKSGSGLQRYYGTCKHCGEKKHSHWTSDNVCWDCNWRDDHLRGASSATK